jgi:tetratricopeptide (TPR) repeat protein
MSGLTIDQMRALLPELDELRPLLERILATSAPDPTHRWSASGELETVGSRRVRPDAVEAGLEGVLERVKGQMTTLYTTVVRGLRALEAGDLTAASRAFLDASELEERAWRMDRAEAWALAAHRAALGQRDRSKATLALRRAARAARGRGRLKEAAERYEAAYREGRSAGDATAAAVAAIGRGNVSVDRGSWRYAEEWYLRALALLEESAPPSSPERWQVRQDLSIVARRRGELEESRRWLEEAEHVAGSVNDPSAKVEIQNGWGMLALAAGDPAAAEARFREALLTAWDPKSLVTVSVNLGHALLEQGRTLEASEAARNAEAEAIRAGVVVKLPEVYRLLGEVAAAWDHEDAVLFYERALELIARDQLPAWERAETLSGYARLLAWAGRDSEAAVYREEAETLRQELASEDESAYRGTPHEETS